MVLNQKNVNYKNVQDSLWFQLEIFIHTMFVVFTHRHTHVQNQKRVPKKRRKKKYSSVTERESINNSMKTQEATANAR